MSKIPIFMKNIYVPIRLFFENYFINFADNKDISQIDDNIFIGNISTATNIELLKEKGITHVIDILSHKFEPYPNEFEYLHIHAYDSVDWDLTYCFPISNQFIRDAIKRGGKIYVHCMCGVSRSVSAVLAYMMSLSEEDVYVLLEKIKESRPIANPNSAFIEQLVKFRENINYVNAMKEMLNKSYDESRNTSQNISPNTLYTVSHNALYNESYRPPAENPYFKRGNGG